MCAHCLLHVRGLSGKSWYKASFSQSFWDIKIKITILLAWLFIYPPHKYCGDWCIFTHETCTIANSTYKNLRQALQIFFAFLQRCCWNWLRPFPTEAVLRTQTGDIRIQQWLGYNVCAKIIPAIALGPVAWPFCVRGYCFSLKKAPFSINLGPLMALFSLNSV